MSATVPIRSVPSPRAGGAWNGLVPNGWTMDEWRGGSCAALRFDVTRDGHSWEVLIMPDGDLSIPRDGDDDVAAWSVFLGRDDEVGAFYVECLDTLDLPAYRAGDQFPHGEVLAWVDRMIDADRFRVI